MSESNMRIWSRVCETDPSHTRQVKQRGGFTAIDAQYQVQRATEMFGPVGTGWGYEAQYHEIPAVAGDNRAVLVQAVDVTLWYRDADEPEAVRQFGPIRGTNPIIDEKGRFDEDAPKKALTDALTKALSHLGFSADVFLGQYDDNKYVAQLAEKYGNGQRGERKDKPATAPAGDAGGKESLL